MTKPAPDPSRDCPRCYHFAHTLDEREDQRRTFKTYPAIDQQRALDVLVRAFPRAFGVKG